MNPITDCFIYLLQTSWRGRRQNAASGRGEYGPLTTLSMRVFVCCGMCECRTMDLCAWRPQREDVSQIAASIPRARDSVPISLAWLWAWERLWLWDAGAWSHWRGTERDVAGPERRGWRMEGKPSWRRLLIGLSRFPWLTRPICSVELKREGERATSKVAGQARLQGWRGVCVVGGQTRGWSHSSSHSLFVTGGRESQLSPPDRSTHTPPCVLITQARWTHKNRRATKKNTYETTTLIKASGSRWGEEWMGQIKKKGRGGQNMKDRKGLDARDQGVKIVLHSSRWIFAACHWKQLEVIKRWTDKESADPPSHPPPCLLDGGVSACRAQGANRFTSHSRQH